MNDNTTAETLPGSDNNVAPSGGQPAVSESVSLASLLKTAIGKEFPDDATALKAVKDTFAYVGKVGKFAPTIEQLQQKFGGEGAVIQKLQELATSSTNTEDLAAKLSGLEKTINGNAFYTANPQFVPYKDLIASMGSDPASVVSTDVFKNTFDKLKATDDTKNDRSVLHTNPRLGAANDTMSQAAAAQKAGNTTQAENLATQAVLDAYPEMKGQ